MGRQPEDGQKALTAAQKSKRQAAKKRAQGFKRTTLYLRETHVEALKLFQKVANEFEPEFNDPKIKSISDQLDSIIEIFFSTYIDRFPADPCFSPEYNQLVELVTSERWHNSKQYRKEQQTYADVFERWHDDEQERTDNFKYME